MLGNLSFVIYCLRMFNTHSFSLSSKSRIIHVCGALFLVFKWNLLYHCPLISLVCGHYTGVANQCLSTLATVTSTGMGRGLTYSTNTCEKIRPIRVLPRTFFFFSRWTAGEEGCINHTPRCMRHCYYWAMRVADFAWLLINKWKPW